MGRSLLYSASIGSIALGVRTIVRGPMPSTVTFGACAAFAGIVLAGVFEPRLGTFADTLCEGVPSPAAPRVALTFDDGPDPRSTPKILDLLDAAGVSATFFVVGRKLDAARRGVVRDAHARGHSIACHSFGHDRLFSLRAGSIVERDLRDALAAITDCVGEPTRLFRPPIGHTNPTIARVAAELGLRIVAWNVRGYDGTRAARADRVARRILAGLADGAIVVMHDGAERDDFTPTAPDALIPILAAMNARGLSGVTVETIAMAPAEVTST